MKTKRTRSAALLVVFILVISLAAGCNNSQSGTPGSSGSATEDWGTIRIATWYQDKTPSEEEQKIRLDFLRERILADRNATFDIEVLFYHQTQWQTQIMLSIISGEVIDVISQDWRQDPGFMPGLGDLLEKHGQNVLARIKPASWKYNTFMGDIRAIPTQTNDQTGRGGMNVRGDILDKWGATVPTNVAEMEALMERGKQEGLIPLIAPNFEQLYYTFASVFEGRPVTNNMLFTNTQTGAIEHDLFSEARTQTIQLLRRFVENGWLSSDFPVASSATASATLTSGQSLFCVEAWKNWSSGEVGSLFDAVPGAYLLPVDYFGNRTQMVPVVNSSCGTPTSKNLEGFIKFLDWVYEDFENYCYAAHGAPDSQMIYDFSEYRDNGGYVYVTQPDRVRDPDYVGVGRYFIALINCDFLEFGTNIRTRNTGDRSPREQAQDTWANAFNDIYNNYPAEKKFNDDAINYRLTSLIEPNMLGEWNQHVADLQRAEQDYIINGTWNDYVAERDRIKGIWENEGFQDEFTKSYKILSGN